MCVFVPHTHTWREDHAQTQPCVCAWSIAQTTSCGDRCGADARPVARRRAVRPPRGHACGAVRVADQPRTIRRDSCELPARHCTRHDIVIDASPHAGRPGCVGTAHHDTVTSVHTPRARRGTRGLARLSPPPAHSILVPTHQVETSDSSSGHSPAIWSAIQPLSSVSSTVPEPSSSIDANTGH